MANALMGKDRVLTDWLTLLMDMTNALTGKGQGANGLTNATNNSP